MNSNSNNDKYRDLRRKVVAHKELTDPAAVSALFAKTNIRELQRLLVFFSRLYVALWQPFFNGKKPTLRPRRYSLKRMRDLPSPPEIGRSVHERIAHETEQFLTAAASPRAAGDARLKATLVRCPLWVGSRPSNERS